MSSIYNISKKYLDDKMHYNKKKKMILTDFLFLLITGLVSIYPVNKLRMYWDRKRRYNKKK
jgi:hypothetical protein